MNAKKRSRFAGVGEHICASEAAWSFGGSTPRHFDGHVSRSVPFYETGHDMIAKLSDFFVKDHSVCYDLGSSTGSLLTRLAHRHRHQRSVSWTGIDVEPAMVALARKRTRKMKNVAFAAGDISRYAYKRTDFVTAYYTIQFIPPRVRQDMFNTIYKKLNWGGAFILFEKVRACDARFQDMMTLLYNDFKLDQHYSPAEIMTKAKSLKGVLEPFSTRGNLDLLKRAGFVDVITVFKYLCFEGFLAIK